MSASLASVVINNYNYGRFLAAAIESALAQEDADVQVIVVDDGSEDGSRTVIEAYAGRAEAVFKSNGGQGSAVNAGFARARGAAVLFLDADDMLLPTAATRVLQALAPGDVSKVHWSMPVIDADGRRTGGFEEAELASGDLREAVLREGPMSDVAVPTAPMSGNGFSRAYLAEVLPMPEREYRISADTYVATLAAAFGRVVELREPQSLYRLHGANTHMRLSLEEVLRRDRADEEILCGILARAYRRRGIEPDTAAWRRRSWWRRVERALDEVCRLVASGATFLLADEGVFGLADEWRGRRRLPFPELNGDYGGLPADDEAAVAELERGRARGASHLVVAWPAFWWLDHFQGFARVLDERYARVFENERLVIFALR